MSDNDLLTASIDEPKKLLVEAAKAISRFTYTASDDFWRVHKSHILKLEDALRKNGYDSGDPLGLRPRAEKVQRETKMDERTFFLMKLSLWSRIKLLFGWKLEIEMIVADGHLRKFSMVVEGETGIPHLRISPMPVLNESWNKSSETVAKNEGE